MSEPLFLADVICEQALIVIDILNVLSLINVINVICDINVINVVHVTRLAVCL